MPWLLNLKETYNANKKEIGVFKKNVYGNEFTLIPIGHTTQTSHIEVNVTKDGEFHSAEIIDKNYSTTIIPATVDSASRSGTAVYPYPLHDNIKYTAGDYVHFSGKNQKVNHYEKYMSQLKKWVDSPYSHPSIKAIYTYLKKGSLIEDLVKTKILCLDDEGKLIEKWNKKYLELYDERPEIFSVVTDKQENAFIRFNVHSPNELLDKPWRDRSLFKSYTQFYSTQLIDEDICYVTGEKLPVTDKHANKIRHAGDKAKLISGNDTSGFTFRGRFSKSEEVASISYLASQKAHNALRWLINKQGRIIDGRVFLIWGNNKVDLSLPWENSLIFSSEMDVEIDVSTEEKFAKEFSKAIDGYKYSLDSNVKINILVIDSATTGRMGVLYYRNMESKFYFNKVKEWHTKHIWRHSFLKENNRIFYLGAPATSDIAIAAYGSHASDKIKKGLMERILPCIIDGRKIPKDIVRSAFYRASNPISMENWEWENTLSVTCFLINKEEKLGVVLDRNNSDRDYLFGRMLAVADALERSAMGPNESRTTNAIRYMNSFSKHPARTWAIIQDAIQPYQAKLGKRSIYFTKIIDEIASKMNIEDFNDKPLSGKYLLGLYSQRYEIFKKNDD